MNKLKTDEHLLKNAVIDSNSMGLYNVEIEATYDASYEGEIDKSYSRLVFAKTEKEAIDFVSKDLGRFNNSCNAEKVQSAFRIDFDKVKRKRVVGYYCL
jgi:hypothetical protein